MLPQSAVLVIAPIAEGREEELRALLGSLNRQPGWADPDNALVPFGKLDRLHLARFVILRDPSPGDIQVHGLPPVSSRPALGVVRRLRRAGRRVSCRVGADLRTRTAANFRVLRRL